MNVCSCLGPFVRAYPLRNVSVSRTCVLSGCYTPFRYTVFLYRRTTSTIPVNGKSIPAVSLSAFCAPKSRSMGSLCAQEWGNYCAHTHTHTHTSTNTNTDTYKTYTTQIHTCPLNAFLSRSTYAWDPRFLFLSPI